MVLLAVIGSFVPLMAAIYFFSCLNGLVMKRVCITYLREVDVSLDTLSFRSTCRLHTRRRVESAV